ncbi:hypothetical protein, partial [Cryobacterium sp. RTS3]|uniref:hypothetical protein n=1 Tax=Cryobacterium sp. RTS3 TaxID=3048643 RepID=UPI0034DD02F7
ETDLDIGHYERFLDINLNQAANVTTPLKPAPQHPPTRANTAPTPRESTFLALKTES